MDPCFRFFEQRLNEASVHPLGCEEFAVNLESAQEMLFAGDTGVDTRSRFTSSEVLQIREGLRRESLLDIKRQDFNIVFKCHETRRLTPAQLRVLANALIYKYAVIEDDKRACAAIRVAKLDDTVRVADGRKRKSQAIDPVIQSEIDERKAASHARLAKAKAEFEARKRLP
jgi:hypothetical protein